MFKGSSGFRTLLNIPQVNPTNFTISGTVTQDEFVGAITASSNPSAWSIIGGNSSGYFAIFLQPDTSAHLRTSASGPIPPAGIYNLTIQATNAAGSGTANSQVTVGAAPVVTNASFSPNTPIAQGATIGTMTSTNSPTTWTITSGDPLGDFAISNSGVITAAQAISGTGSETLTVQATNGLGSGTGTATINWAPAGTGTFPGQSGNPVGFAATPAAVPANWTGGTWPGAYPGSLTVMSGSSITAGTAGSPNIYAFKDFNAGTGATGIPSHTRFVGCRFQSNDVNDNNVNLNNTGDVEFHYCSVVPLVSLATAPPPQGGPSWPACGTGANVNPGTTGSGYQISGNNGYQYGILIAGTSQPGPILIDHCDIWGFGNAIPIQNNSTISITIQDCWIHDAADAAAHSYHTDGPGYLNGSTAPSNITINHCTIASIGNTNCIAFQVATTSYTNFTITSNYLSGFGANSDFGHNVAGNSNWTVADNIWATDVQFGTPCYTNFSAMFTTSNGLNNVWQRNKLSVYPGSLPESGTGFTFTSANNGNYVWPDNSLNTTDWQSSIDPFASADGRSAAPTGTPQLPTLLNTYHPSGTIDARYNWPSNRALNTTSGNLQQPAWHVAGVDYYVGCPQNLSLQNWQTLSQAGVTVGTNSVTVTGTNVTLNGIDFSGGGGAELIISGSGCIVQNCNFLFGSSNIANYAVIQINNPNWTIKYCNVSGNGAALSAQITAAFPNTQSTLVNVAAAAINGTMQYNYFTDFVSHVIEYDAGTNSSLTYQYCLVYNGGTAIQGPAFHLNFLQGGENNCTTTQTVSYNTSYMPVIPKTGGEGFQGYSNGNNATTNTTFTNNTIIGSPNGDGTPHLSTDGVAGISNTVANTTANHNYIDKRGSTTFFFTDSTAGTTSAYSNNVDMATGNSIPNTPPFT